MNNNDRDNKSLEILVDDILAKIAEELTNSRDKYLEYVMNENSDGEWSSSKGSGFSGNGFDGQGRGYSGPASNSGNKKSGIVKKIVIGIIVALLAIAAMVMIALGIYSVKTDSKKVEESTVEEGTAIEEPESAEAEEYNPNIMAMEALMEEAPDVRMEYVDCIIRDMEYGEDNTIREITLVLKNTGNRIICEPSISFSGVNEYDSPGAIGATAAVLPGQYIMLRGNVTDLSREYLELGSTVEVFYSAPWKYEDIPLENAPEKISVKEAMDESKELAVYPKADINLIVGSVDNSLNGSDIGLEIVDISIQNNHACVEIRNNTEYTIQTASVCLCVLDENGNIIDSGGLLNYNTIIPSGETAKEYFPLLREEKERYVVPVFWNYSCDAYREELAFAMTYLDEITKAVGH